MDSADQPTRERYRAYVDSRTERTKTAHGPRGVLFAPDLIGTGEQIAEQLYADAAFVVTEELRVELPYELGLDDYRQILSDVAENLAPQLGWRPAVAALAG